MIHLTTLLLTLAAFVCLACSMERPQQDLFQRALQAPVTRRFRAVGWVLLALALGLSLATEAWTLALVAWVGHTSAGAALVYLALLSLPKRHRHGPRK